MLRAALFADDRPDFQGRRSTVDETTLVAAARRGSRPAFLRLAESYQGRVRAVTGAVLPEPEAGVVARDALVETWRRLPGLPAGSHFAPFLFTVVREVALEAPTSTAGRAGAEPAPSPPEPSAPAPSRTPAGEPPTGSAKSPASPQAGPAAPTSPATEPTGSSPVSVPPHSPSGRGSGPVGSTDTSPRALLSTGLAGLDAEQREAFLLACVAGLRYEEVASVVGRSPAAVANDVYRARVRIAAVLTGDQEPRNDRS
jgi:DNA-directed RNA polymerase specialized sigma24 family protein